MWILPYIQAKHPPSTFSPVFSTYTKHEERDHPQDWCSRHSPSRFQCTSSPPSFQFPKTGAQSSPFRAGKRSPALQVTEGTLGSQTCLCSACFFEKEQKGDVGEKEARKNMKNTGHRVWPHADPSLVRVLDPLCRLGSHRQQSSHLVQASNLQTRKQKSKSNLWTCPRSYQC